MECPSCTAATTVGTPIPTWVRGFALSRQSWHAPRRLVTYGTIICDMSEKHIEYRLRDKVKQFGGLAIKLTASGFTGLPDRLVLMPGGYVYFIELKNGNRGVLSARQLVVHKILERLGFKVWIVKDEETLQEFLDAICLI